MNNKHMRNDIMGKHIGEPCQSPQGKNVNKMFIQVRSAEKVVGVRSTGKICTSPATKPTSFMQSDGKEGKVSNSPCVLLFTLSPISTRNHSLYDTEQTTLHVCLSIGWRKIKF